MKRLTILGSTGSIGTQSLEVAEAAGYEIFGLAAHSNISLLQTQIQLFRPRFVTVVDEAAAAAIKPFLASIKKPPVLLHGQQGLVELAKMPGADILLNAVVGIAGLQPTLAAIESGKDVALANKETLVAGGQLVMQAVRENGVRLLPVDSEHSAIFQCLQDPYSAKQVKRLILTASGGPFFGCTQDMLASVTKEQALRHPNWSMGAKITIDSATLMNKGLELIEAVWLFAAEPKSIDIVVHRESIIHSMVEFADHAVLAQLGLPDMRIPIQYALTYPERMAGPAPRLDFKNLTSLSFGRPDEETFRCLAACRKAIEKGGLYPCAANGANEAAVALFLQDKISFLDIGRLVEGAVDTMKCKDEYTLKDIFACDRAAREYVAVHSK